MIVLDAKPRIDLTGRVFGKLTVVRFSHVVKYERCNGLAYYWECKCECGNTPIVHRSALKKGETRSCGCLHKELLSIQRTTHGKSKTGTFRVWAGLFQRCNNKKNPGYKDYGGRGISICERWQNFENFFQDMGERPKGKTLDRINFDGNYEPGNCRWSTPTEQAQNTRRNVFVEWGGEKLTISEWSRRLGLNPCSLKQRLARWPLEKALTTPKKMNAVAA